VAIPGIKPVPSIGLSGTEINTGKWTPEASPAPVSGGFQLFFKLHGSSNWLDASGKQLLVTGILVSSLQDHVIGASRRSLHDTFGGDRVEHAKVMRFFCLDPMERGGCGLGRCPQRATT
jgi:hypothetical protein